MGNFFLEPCFSLGMFYALDKVDFVFNHVFCFLFFFGMCTLRFDVGFAFFYIKNE